MALKAMPSAEAAAIVLDAARAGPLGRCVKLTACSAPCDIRHFRLALTSHA